MRFQTIPISRKFEFAQNLDINGKNGTQDGALIWKSDQRKFDFWKKCLKKKPKFNFWNIFTMI